MSSVHTARRGPFRSRERTNLGRPPHPRAPRAVSAAVEDAASALGATCPDADCGRDGLRRPCNARPCGVGDGAGHALPRETAGVGRSRPWTPPVLLGGAGLSRRRVRCAALAALDARSRAVATPAPGRSQAQLEAASPWISRPLGSMLPRRPSRARRAVCPSDRVTGSGWSFPRPSGRPRDVAPSSKKGRAVQPHSIPLEGTEARVAVRRGDDGRPSEQTWAPIEPTATLRGPETAVFALRCRRYARQIGLNAADKVLFIADGAPWIWRPPRSGSRRHRCSG